MRPRGGDGGRGTLDFGPIADVATGKRKRSAVFGRKLRLIGAGEAPHAMAASEQAIGERAANARTGAGEDEIHVRMEANGIWRRG